MPTSISIGKTTFGIHCLTMTTTASDIRRMPAEWELSSAVLLSWPHENTDWNYMLDEVTACYRQLVEAFAARHIPVVIVAPDTAAVKQQLTGIETSGILFFDVATNDTWTRDFGPITVEEGDSLKVLDFKFNGWGLKFAACFDNLVTSKMCGASLIVAPRENHLSFVLEGGSIESDGNGTILTTAECLMSPNRNGAMSRAEIEAYLKSALGAKRILWLNSGALAGDDTDSHVDTLARIAPHDTIIFTGCDDPADCHYASLKAMEDEICQLRTVDDRPYNLIRLPLPDAQFDEEGNRLPATYCNYLVLPEAVFMPTYGNPLKDMTAAQMLQMVFEKEVVSIDCRPLIKQHGSLHCATMQLPTKTLCI